MCEEDFSLLTPVSARLKRALTSLKAGGLSKQFSVAVVALSEGETGGIWLRPRPLHPECCGLTVGLESYAPTYDRLNKALQKNPAAFQWLLSRGLIAGNSSGGVQPAGGLGNPLDPSKTMLFFEWVMANKQENLLELFSLGPTQMHLKYVFDGASPRCGWPHTWEELWDQYVAGGGDVPASGKVAYTASNYLKYLRRSTDVPEGGCIKKELPYPDGSESAAVAWLTHQAGNAAHAKAVYDNPASIGLGQRRPFKTVWAEVNAYAMNLGW